MGETSKIEWTDATWNPWQGCTKVSPACEHCYMFRDMKRYARDGSKVVRSKSIFNLPLKKKQGGAFGITPGSKVFTCSWSDWFHKAADGWRDEAWEIIRQRPDVIFQIVTKRVDRIADHLPRDWGNGWPNVWLIATVENQEWANKRVPLLIDVPAAVRGLSIEPLLGPINLERMNALDRLQWVIVGGESGPGARPMHPQWARSLLDQCQAAEVPFFFKQWGEWVPVSRPTDADEVVQAFNSFPGGKWLDIDGGDTHKTWSCVRVDRVGKKAAGRMLDGQEWSEFPAVKGGVI